MVYNVFSRIFLKTLSSEKSEPSALSALVVPRLIIQNVTWEKSGLFGAHKQCFMNELLSFSKCTMFLNVCVFVNKTFYNVFSMFYFFFLN